MSLSDIQAMRKAEFDAQSKQAFHVAVADYFEIRLSNGELDTLDDAQELFGISTETANSWLKERYVGFSMDACAVR